MKPKPLSNQTPAFVVVAHAFGVAFAWLALHFSAEEIRTVWNEERMHLIPLPGFAFLILDTDTLLKVQWSIAVTAAGFAVWLDRKLMLRLAALQDSRAVKIWSYSTFGVLLLIMGVCLGYTRYWIWWSGPPFGSIT